MIVTHKKYFGLLMVLFSVFFFGGCSKRAKQPQEMSFDELKTKAMDSIDRKKSEYAIGYLEQLVSQFPESQDIFEYKFMLADLYLKVGRLEEAYKLYKHYTKFYPSETKAEDAHYKSILSKFYQTLKVSKSCDDTDAIKTVKRCKVYLKNNSFEKYSEDIKDIKYTCERRLIDKEVYVFNTYLRKQKFQSAQNRIEYLKTAFLQGHPSLEAHILYLEGRLAQKQKNGDLVKKKAEILFEKYPQSQFTKMAQGLISSKRNFIF